MNFQWTNIFSGSKFSMKNTKLQTALNLKLKHELSTINTISGGILVTNYISSICFCINLFKLWQYLNLFRVQAQSASVTTSPIRKYWSEMLQCSSWEFFTTNLFPGPENSSQPMCFLVLRILHNQCVSWHFSFSLRRRTSRSNRGTTPPEKWWRIKNVLCKLLHVFWNSILTKHI